VAVEVNAVDLSMTDDEIDEFRFFEYVKVNSPAHLLTNYMLVTKLDIDLDNPQNNKLTLGLDYDTFTEKQVSTEKVIKNLDAEVKETQTSLPKDYIKSLYDTYPSQLVNAYVDGEFVNLTSGTVYYAYNRNRCRSHEVIKENEPLFIGQDFNVGKMASTVYVQRPNGWHAVAELCDLFDTPDVVRVITERWKDAGHRIIIYPDASGKNRKSVGASSSDIALLQQAGFEVRAKDSNPAVKDRILSTVKAFESGKVWVNDALCPQTARSLEQQAYDKNGEPAKDGIIDHQNDATTYPIVYEMPVIKPLADVKIKFSW
jgi:hypothetical protein